MWKLLPALKGWDGMRWDSYWYLNFLSGVGAGAQALEAAYKSAASTSLNSHQPILKRGQPLPHQHQGEHDQNMICAINKWMENFFQHSIENLRHLLSRRCWVWADCLEDYNLISRDCWVELSELPEIRLLPMAPWMPSINIEFRTVSSSVACLSLRRCVRYSVGQFVLRLFRCAITPL